MNKPEGGALLLLGGLALCALLGLGAARCAPPPPDERPLHQIGLGSEVSIDPSLEAADYQLGLVRERREVALHKGSVSLPAP